MEEQEGGQAEESRGAPSAALLCFKLSKASYRYICETLKWFQNYIVLDFNSPSGGPYCFSRCCDK